MPWISRRELNYFSSEIERLRSMADRERERADRAVDDLMMVHGSLPIGEETRREVKTKKEKVTEAILGLGELLADETAHLEPNGEGEVPPEPEITD